jgi:hypothetical protein
LEKKLLERILAKMWLAENKMTKLQRATYPLLAFAAVAALQIIWFYHFGRPVADGDADPWAVATATVSWWSEYLEGGWPWLAYTYGLSGAFTVAMLQRFLAARRENGSGALEGGLAVGGVTLTGAVAASACFMLGCCGSPMLAVWLSVFGASQLPYEKPFIALLTTTMLGLVWLWMARRRRCACSSASSC